jgi:hypothetical protein
MRAGEEAGSWSGTGTEPDHPTSKKGNDDFSIFEWDSIFGSSAVSCLTPDSAGPQHKLGSVWR